MNKQNNRDKYPEIANFVDNFRKTGIDFKVTYVSDVINDPVLLESRKKSITSDKMHFNKFAIKCDICYWVD